MRSAPALSDCDSFAHKSACHSVTSFALESDIVIPKKQVIQSPEAVSDRVICIKPAKCSEMAMLYHCPSSHIRLNAKTGTLHSSPVDSGNAASMVVVVNRGHWQMTSN